MWHLCFGLQAGLKRFLAAFVLRLLRRAEQGWSSVLGSWLSQQRLGAQRGCPARPAPPRVAAICLCFGSPGSAGRCCRALPALFPKKCFQPPSTRSGCPCLVSPEEHTSIRAPFPGQTWAAVAAGAGRHRRGAGGPGGAPAGCCGMPRNVPLLPRSGLKVPRRP